MSKPRNALLGDKDKFEESCETTSHETYCATVKTDRSMNQKLVHYDAHTLLAAGAIRTLFCQGTIFVANRTLYINMLQYILMSMASMLIYLSIPPGPDRTKDNAPGGFVGAVLTLSRDLQNLTPFIFGLFVSLILARWWAMRVSSLGVVMDSITFNSMFIAGAAARRSKSPEELAEYEKDIMKVVKLGIASLQCMTVLSCGEVDLGKMVETELLTVEEAKALEPCPNRAQVLWAWIGSLGANILERLKTPPPNFNPLYMKNKAAANAITSMEAYYDSQLPFPYVHMIVMLVTANNAMMAIVAGLQMAQAVQEGETAEFILRLMNLIVVPTMYQALLFICFLVEDPLGDDVTDFPMMAFQSSTYLTCKVVLAGTYRFWDLRRKEGLHN